MMSYYQITEDKVFLSGHVACPGCSEALAIRYIMNTLGPRTAVVIPPSCAAPISGAQPYSSMKVPIYQTTLEASAASAAGIKRALNAKGKDDVNVVVLAGDGGTYDIGFQSLSAAAERNEDIIYVCLDNEGYQNTGSQKSSSTPRLAYTTSTPAGKTSPKKNLAEIMVAHKIPYMATATVGFLDDLVRKIQKAKEMKGTRLILVLCPCLAGWGLPDNASAKIARLAVDTGTFPLYEVENGEKYTINRGFQGVPLTAYLSEQSRYKHLTQEQIDELQQGVLHEWEWLKKRSEIEM